MVTVWWTEMIALIKQMIKRLVYCFLYNFWLNYSPQTTYEKSLCHRAWQNGGNSTRKHKRVVGWLVFNGTFGLKIKWDKRQNERAIEAWANIGWLKGHSGADWPIFFSRSIKSLIYNIFTYKVWTPNFWPLTVKIESFILTLGNSGLTNSAGRSRAVR